MNDSALELCMVVAKLAARGWCQGTGGNFSVVVDSDPVRLLITRSGVHKAHLTEDDLILVDGAGRAAKANDGPPSAETLLHTTIVARTGAGSVLHTHSIWATLLGQHFLDGGGLSITGYEMQKGLEGITSHDEAVWVPIVPNDQDMTRLSGRFDALLTQHPQPQGILIAGHGLYTWEKGVDTALRHVEIFEFLFELVGRRTQFEPFTSDQ